MWYMCLSLDARGKNGRSGGGGGGGEEEGEGEVVKSKTVWPRQREAAKILDLESTVDAKR